MSEKRPKLTIEMDLLQNYPVIREELKKEIESNYPNEPEKVEEQMKLMDEAHKLAMGMQEITEIVDQKMLEAEKGALEFLKSSPERIPYYLQQLTQKYAQWQQEQKEQ